MRWLTRWARRIAYFFRRGREERDLDEEMRFHVDMEAAELLRAGMDPGEARRRARVAFGGVDRYREEVRGARGVLWLDQLRQDLAYAARTLRRSPGFAAGALLVLAIGIGATTAAFGVVQAVLLRPLPYPDPDALVRVWPAMPERGLDRTTFSVPDFRDWRERSEALSHLALYSTLPSPLVLTGEGPAEEIPTAYVAGDFFGTIGVPAQVGRTLRPDEEQAASRVVVLSHDYWQRRFGGDPGLVGRVLTIDQQPFEVVGVMPPDFALPGDDVEAWAYLAIVPQTSIPHELRGVRFLSAVGRLAPGAGVERARDELTAVAAGLARDLPDTNRQQTAATVEPLQEVMVGDVRARLWLVLGAVALILVIACANVSGLLLARGGQRRAEIAVRMSLGADRSRVVRQLLAEAGILGGLGGMLGIALAWLGTWAVVRYGGDFVPRSGEVGLDPAVLLFALALTAVTVALFGVLPALRTADDRVGAALAAGGRRSTGTRASVRLRRGLVGAEVAVSVVLLVGAMLLVESFRELRSVDPGFEPEGVASMTLTLAIEKYPTREEYMPLYREMVDRMRAIPGVAAVGSIRRLPFRGGGETWGFSIPGVFEPPPEEAPGVEVIHVGADLFEALGIRVLEGRVFDERDGVDAPVRLVVNEAFVRTYAQDTRLVGRQIGVMEGAEVIGVVEDVRQRGLDAEPEPTIYVHMEQNPRIGMGIVARVAGTDPVQVLGAMRNVVVELDPDQPITDLAPMAAILDDSVAAPRLLALLLGGFAALAAVLASLGVYGVIATVVRQRMREVGLRMALGAGRGEVVGLVVRQGMAPALVGLAVGLVAAAALSGVMETVLFEIAPLDASAYVAAGGLLALLALVACGVPAVWASRLEPARVLREE